MLYNIIPDVLKLIKEEYQDKQNFALQGNVEKLSFSISFNVETN